MRALAKNATRDYNEPMEYSIGEFSLIAKLTVKALRFYQEQGLLEPARTDAFTSYRYYREDQLEKAGMIKTLREWDFSVDEIRETLLKAGCDEDLTPYLERKLGQTRESIALLGLRAQQLESALSSFKEETVGKSGEIFIKEIGAMRIASRRHNGRYSEYGGIISGLYKAFGRWACGKPMALYHDDEYKEDGADFEASLPVREDAVGPEVRELASCKVVSIVHRGSYETLSASYKSLTDYVKKNGLRVARPTREVYLKGPGMFFKGNPARYLTEIQFPVEEP